MKYFNYKSTGRNIAIIIFLLLANSGVQAQSLFQLNGNGGQADLGNNCFRLTQASGNQFGSMWYRKKADLNQDFDIEANLNFGSNNGGADGIVFAFQNVCTSAGGNGGGMGITGVNPSFFVEFDTYTNGEYNDPNYDHIAILKNGNVNHASANSLVAPTGIISGNGNVETGADFLVRVWWTAADTTLRVYVNNDLRIAYSGNVVSGIFGGNPYVYWGFTAATGGLNNVHRVCMVNFPANEIDLEDVSICENDSVQVNLPGGVTYAWTPNYNISSTSISNPHLYPLVNTTYVVSITDACNNIQTDTITVTVNPLPNVALNLPFTQQCLNNSAINLSGASPNGGIYSGPGVSNGQFNPATAGTGNQIIAYTFTDGNGCSATATDNVTVNTLPDVTLNSFPDQCGNDPVFNLTGGIPAGGTYSGQGVSANQFNPAIAGTGTHVITYTFTNATGCVGSATTSIEVNASPAANISTPNGTIICSGASVSLTTNATAGVSYEWFLNGISQSSSAPGNTSFTASSAGNYTLVATGNTGCSSTSSTITVTNGTSITASLTAANTNFCPGESVALSSNLGAGSTIAWFLNNNLINGASNAGFSATSGGIYHVLITSSTGCTATSNTITLTQLSSPVANASSSLPAFCPGTTTVSLNTTAVAGATYQWLNNNNPIANATNQNYSTNTAGNFSVIVSLNGCSDTSAAIALINAGNPVISLTTPDSTYCTGTGLLSVTLIPGAVYHWYLNGNSIAGATNSINTTANGNYYVIVTDNNLCSTTSNEITMLEVNAPAVNISASNTTICSGSNVTLTANTVAGATYEWKRNNVSLGAPSSNNTYSVTLAGSYNCEVNNGCIGTSNTIVINVSDVPAAPSNLLSGTDYPCAGGWDTYEVAAVNGATGYTWSISPANAAFVQQGQGTSEVVITFLNQNCTINVLAFNSCGTSANATLPVTIDNSFFCNGSNVAFGAASTNTCVGSTVTFYNYSDQSITQFYTPLWNFGPGASPATSNATGPVTVTYSSAGFKDVSLEYLDMFGNSIDGFGVTSYINVNGTINTGTISGLSLLPNCTGNTETYSVVNTPGSTYNWSVNGGVINAGQNTNQITVTFPSSGGTVSVTETNSAGCVGTTVNLPVNCLTEILNQDVPSISATIYPNPNNGYFTISTTLNQNLKCSIEIYDIKGHIIYQENSQIKAGNNFNGIDLSQVAKGLYFAKIQLGEQCYNHKIIIQ